jgi:hypothetical protein
MAFAPDYAASGRFYVFYTDNDGDIRVEERTRSAADPDMADPASARTLLVQEHSAASNHNGGQLQIGPDGRLYVSIGDGAVDPSDAQDPGTFLGKITRIDPANGAAEVYARGLRNPYRFSFDRATGDLTIGDVGQAAQEEVDLLGAGAAPGANFGWPACEGSVCTGPAPANYVPPVLTYANDASTCAITGGYVVRDPTQPALAGRYVYGDFCAGALRSAVLAQGGASGDAPLGLTVSMLASFGEDAAGCLYAVSLDGPVYRVAPSAAAGPGPCALPSGGPAPPAPGPPGPAADTTRPRLVLSHRRRQRLGRRRSVALAARCDEPCRLTARATLHVHGSRRVARLRGVRRSAAAGERVRLRVVFGPRARARALRARRASVLVRVSAADAAGNVRRAAVRIVLVRG